MNGTKRIILVADDEFINREILSEVLKDSYELLFAETGTETLEQISENRETLSLVLLDLNMPGMHGMEVLRRMKADPGMQRIPVIVMTSDQGSEVESLQLGAVDFIPKPYPQKEVILARIRRTIELSEDRDIIRSTERDSLTGLYNREYFYRYARQLDKNRASEPMDAIVLNVNHFHMINERFGRAAGDELLKRIAEKLRGIFGPGGGIVCRRDGDNFLIYCPHREDYRQILEQASAELSAEEGISGRVRLRMGIFCVVDRSIEMERRFDRAKLAADTVRGNFVRNYAVYDKELHESELFAEQLLEDFHDAVKERQFQVWYQPKFDVRPGTPVLTSAEALVRWMHPKLGMVSPGLFIPLFEKNGLIVELDHYVWREAAARMRDWKDRLGFSVPVSVNVSRVDMYDPNLVNVFQDLMKEFSLTPREFLLEITESAYTQDSEQMISVVMKLRKLGFRIEMDDFGTGYSSLNMISTLPIDALKLDMQFIRSAFRGTKDTRMLEVILEIADYLSVPVIAEGVETEDQLHVLKAMGCDIVQGYYFSRPLPAEQYEEFLKQRRDSSPVLTEPEAGIPEDSVSGSLKDGSEELRLRYSRITRALAADYFCIYCVDMETDRFVEYSAQENYRALGIEAGGDHFFERTRENIARVIWHEDQDRVRKAMKKETILKELERDGIFTINYRLMLDGVPTYVSLKATRMEEPSDNHIIIGICSIDAQMKREQEYERELGIVKERVNRDALTGVKSKHAYVDAEAGLDREIREGKAEPFAVALCDVNDLKKTNDNFGHKAGDQLLKDACAIICDTFKHSPVYRIGGDEFAAILRGQDYETRNGLLARFQERNRRALDRGGIVVACGMSEFRPGEDGAMAAVFERADAEMYRNKTELKIGRQ